MAKPTRYCDYEKKEVPESELCHLKDFGWIHNVTPAHNLEGYLLSTSTGGPDNPTLKVATSEDSKSDSGNK